VFTGHHIKCLYSCAVSWASQLTSACLMSLHSSRLLVWWHVLHYACFCQLRNVCVSSLIFSVVHWILHCSACIYSTGDRYWQRHCKSWIITIIIMALYNTCQISVVYYMQIRQTNKKGDVTVARTEMWVTVSKSINTRHIINKKLLVCHSRAKQKCL